MSSLRLVCLVAVSLCAAAHADDGTGNEPCANDPHDLPACDYPADALLPDLLTVVPKHLSIHNQQQREFLRFSNGLANLGAGPWWLEPEFPSVADGQTCQKAFQLISGADDFPNRELPVTDEDIPAPDGTHAVRCEKGNFDFHETHNHWHIDNVGEFKVCAAADFDADAEDCAPALTAGGTPSAGIKFTFCLVDWYKLGDNGPTSDSTRNFFACETGFQGITPGWVDQYHHSTVGQEVDITGLPAGDYVLVSTVNVGALDGHPVFEETDPANNTAYVRFELLRHSNGNPKIGGESGACDDPDHLALVADAVDAFIQAFHPGDADLAAKVLDDMCGGKSTNK